MRGVDAAGRQDVDPEILQRDRLVAQIKRQILDKGGDVGVKRFLEVGEDRKS